MFKVKFHNRSDEYRKKSFAKACQEARKTQKFDKSNAQLAKELGISKRQASKKRANGEQMDIFITFMVAWYVIKAIANFVASGRAIDEDEGFTHFAIGLLDLCIVTWGLILLLK